MEFFSKYDAGDYFNAIKKMIKDEVNSMSDSEINNCDFEAWLDYICSKSEVEPIVLFEDNIEQNLTEQKVRKYNHFHRVSPYEKEYYDIDGYCISFKTYYDGNADLFLLRPSHWIMRSFSPATFQKPTGTDCGYFILEQVYSKNELDGKSDVQSYIQNAFNSDFTSYKEMIQYVNNEVVTFNASIRKFTEELLTTRKEKASAFATLSKKLEIPLKLSSDAPNTKPIPLNRINRTPPQRPSNKPEPTEYSISNENYININNIIAMNGTAMEKTARTYYRNNEEELRDHLLATLNTHYENVTGETFRKIGKTDILIEFENKAAFIGECKIWYGIKQFREAIQQMLNYSTWRDSKGSIVIFNKENKNFQNIITTVEQWINENTKSHKRLKNNIWDCSYFREDIQLEVQINISIFDLHVDESQFKDMRYTKK